MRQDNLTVFVIEDDPAVRDSLALMLGLAGFKTALFGNAEAFLGAYRKEWAGCVVTDLRLPGMSGVGLQTELRTRGSTLPVVIITAHGDVPTARLAFQAQAVDFLEKPFDDAQLRSAIEAAFRLEEQRIQHSQARVGDAERLAKLTSREREVLVHAANGLHAKEIAVALGISPRTVEVHKTRLMAKLGVRNIAELVRFSVSAEARSENER